MIPQTRRAAPGAAPRDGLVDPVDFEFTRVVVDQARRHPHDHLLLDEHVDVSGNFRQQSAVGILDLHRRFIIQIEPARRQVGGPDDGAASAASALTVGVVQ